MMAYYKLMMVKGLLMMVKCSLIIHSFYEHFRGRSILKGRRYYLYTEVQMVLPSC